jgi:hypothetical protein
MLWPPAGCGGKVWTLPKLCWRASSCHSTADPRKE